MTALDIFVILLLGGAAMIGFVRGFAHEVLALFAWIVAIAALKLFHTPLQHVLVGPVGNEAGASAVAFGLLFFPAYIAVKLFARAVGGKTRRSILGPVDRVLGGGFGMLKGLLGATLFFLLANLATDMVYGPRAPRPEWMTSSRTYPLLNATGRAVVDWVETARGDGDVDTAS
jgi:membrane protein required for colicin V production